MKMYKTKPIDYTGCDEIIREHLQLGEMVLCDVHSGEGSTTHQKFVIGYSITGHGIYFTRSGDYRYATPVQQAQYVKKASEIVKWLEDNGYKVSGGGAWLKTDEEGRGLEGCPNFYAGMFVFCGKTPFADNEWREEWLEYR